MEVQVAVEYGMNQTLITQVEQLVREIEEVEVIDQVMEPLVVEAEQVQLGEMLEANILEGMEVMVFNPRLLEQPHIMAVAVVAE